VRSVAIVMVLLAPGVAVADDPAPNRVDVEVGKSVERDVGYARGGWFCDDTTLVTGELYTRDDHNFWNITGVKAGSTQCRVGMDLHRPYVVFDVVVSDPPKPKPQPPKAKPK
jgi:hypothetical protein